MMRSLLCGGTQERDTEYDRVGMREPSQSIEMKGDQPKSHPGERLWCRLKPREVDVGMEVDCGCDR